MSPPDTQDVFHTPPEESSLPSSDDQRRTLTADVVDRCAVNQAVDVDAGTQGFVDFGGSSDGSEFVDLERDSELGFSESHLAQEIGVLKRESSDLGETPVKKLKLSEQDLGFESSGDCLGVQLQKVEEGMGTCSKGKGKLVSDADTESPCNFGEYLQPQVNVLGFEQVQLEKVTSAGDVNLVEGNKSGDEVTEGSGMRDKSDESESGKGQEKKKNKYSVFDVLRVLAEKEVEDNLDNGNSLLEAAMLRGLTFPRPSWWPDNYHFSIKKE